MQNDSEKIVDSEPRQIDSPQSEEAREILEKALEETRACLKFQAITRANGLLRTGA